MIQDHCKAGQVLEGKEAREKKLELETVLTDGGWPVLRRCFRCGGYWESTWEGRYAEREYLTCLEDEEVTLRWGDQLRERKS
jgi:hypothetical protein